MDGLTGDMAEWECERQLNHLGFGFDCLVAFAIHRRGRAESEETK